MASGIVSFSWDEWIAIYPEFSGPVTAPRATNAFNFATTILNNTPTSPVCNVSQRQTLLYLLTAHICQLLYGSQGNEKSPLVGRIASAGQGSVNVAVELKMPDSAAWFTQTTYGAMYWQMTLPWRTATYVIGPSAIYQQPAPSSIAGLGGVYVAGPVR